MKTIDKLTRAIEAAKEKIENSKIELRKTIDNLSTEIDIAYYLDEDIKSFDELRDAIDNGGGFDIEIIYYYNAMEYLMKNDTSLNRSLEIADGLGYSPKNLNSEILASLLASEVEREDFEELENTFDTYFEELEELNNKLESIEEIEENDFESLSVSELKELIEELENL